MGSTAGYLGFAGGGFDESRLWDRSGEGVLNALALDSIELAGGAGPEPVPEPTTLALLGAGLVAVCARRRARSTSR
jgi:hypothetical protein